MDLKFDRRPDPVLVVKYTSLTVAIIAAVAVGWMAHDDLAPAPHACTVAFNLDAKADIVANNLLSAVNARGDALERDTYRALDADVVALLDELEPLEADADEAAAECLGGAR